LFSQKLVAYERDPHTVDRLSHTAAEGESVAEGNIPNNGSGGGGGSGGSGGGSGSRSGNGGGGGVAALPTHVRAAEESFDASASTARQELAAAETALDALLKLQPTTRAGVGAGEATGEVFLTTS
jgi:hypothetical protein